MDIRNAFSRRGFLGRLSVTGTAGLLGVLGAPLSVFGFGRTAKSLREITVEDFSDVLGAEFRLKTETGQSLSVELIEAEPLGSGGVRRRPFSIVFRAPRQVRLTQGIYKLQHSRLGSMNLLMTPVDLPARSNHLQAVFG